MEGCAPTTYAMNVFRRHTAKVKTKQLEIQLLFISDYNIILVMTLFHLLNTKQFILNQYHLRSSGHECSKHLKTKVSV